MTRERDLWEKRHEARTSSPLAPPSLFLQNEVARLRVGRALDVACGDGRNTLYLARQHFVVDAIDIARAGLMRAKLEAARQGLPARFIQGDLDAFSLPVGRYDVVVNVRYLNRRLVPALKNTLREGGMVVFETFLRQQAEIGHPRNPDFLLERGELLHRFEDFDVLIYEEGLFQTEKDQAFMARILAQRPIGWEAD
jgi:2-polyprenyl-3-methyl-5-hydroxy-6-metoxy-1,4-benzoquinol methylase